MVGLNPLLNILVICGAGILGWLEFNRLNRKYEKLEFVQITKVAPYLYVLVILLAVLFALLYGLQLFPGLWWELPLWLEYSFMMIIWGSIIFLFTFLLGLSLTAACVLKHQERLKLIFAGALVIVGIEIAHVQYTAPSWPELREIVTKDGIVLQSSGSTCAAASAANVARHFGISKTEKEMALLLGTTTFLGTSSANVIYGMRKIGLDCERADFGERSVADVPSFTMLMIDNPDVGPEGHMVMYAGMKNEKIEIWDPLNSRIFYSSENFSLIWHGRGITCRLSGEK